MAVTNLIRCTDGVQVVLAGTIVFNGNVARIDNVCYSLQGYSEEGSGGPYGSVQGFHANCDSCAVAAAGSFYQLVNCLDNSDKIDTLTAGMGSYVGQIIKIGTKCYTVFAQAPGKFGGVLTDVDLTSPNISATCAACLNTYWKLTHCDNGSVIYLAEAAYNSIDGSTVKVAGGCYTIEKILTGETLTVNPNPITQNFGFDNCLDCLEANYFRLENCNNPSDFYYVPEGSGPLVQATHQNKIIKININGESKCWKVTFVSLPQSTSSQEWEGALLGVFNNCTDCEIDGFIEVPSDLEGPTVFELFEGNDECDKLSIRNLTLLYEDTLYAETVLPVLEITFSDGYKLKLDNTTLSIMDESWQGPYDPLNPSQTIEITVDDIIANIASGILLDPDGEVTDTVPWEVFPDGVYTIKWQFNTAGDTTGEYSTTEKKYFICSIKKCYVEKAQDFLDKGCGSGCNKSASEAPELIEMMILIDAVRNNMDLGRYDCAQKVIEALKKYCNEDCGCQA